jgi:hypothetical protein
MSKEVLRFSTAVICAVMCVTCPITIVWFGYTYGFDRLASDFKFKTWRAHTFEGLFWVALLATFGLFAAMRKWW